MTNDNAEMERGVAQVLNNFEPGDTFDFGKHGISMMVNRWEVERMTDIDEAKVSDHIASKVRGFRNSNQRPWGSLGEVELDFFRPQKVYGDVFPRLLECQDCGAVEYKDSTEYITYTNGKCERETCNGNLKQVAFVLVHECGSIRSIPPKPCSSHRYEYIQLDRGSPEDMTTWNFKCGICGRRTGTLDGKCNSCGEHISRAKPLSSGSVFYPQRDVIVDIPTVEKESGAIPYGEDWARVVMHAYLGAVDLDEDGVTLERVATKEGTRSEEIEDLIDEVGEEHRDSILETVSSGPPAREDVVESNREDVNLPGEDLDDSIYSLTANELLTFLRCSHGYEGPDSQVENSERHPSPTSIDDYLEQDGFMEKYPQAKQYRDKLEKVNICGAWIVDNFPLLSFSFGYTRGSPEASETNLHPFDHPYAADAIPVYCDRSPAEAIVLEIDRESILEWLVDEEVVPAEKTPGDDERARKIWFLENVDIRQVQNPFDPIEDQTTQMIYRVLHSMSHALMATASEQCGLDSDSISEVILPSVPAIILYGQSMEHFALGGMFTLFKTRIHPWIDDSIAHAERCIYDPACRSDEGGAACHACLHASEFTCEYYNEELDRTVLVGDDNTQPFWNI